MTLSRTPTDGRWVSVAEGFVDKMSFVSSYWNPKDQRRAMGLKVLLALFLGHLTTLKT